MNDNGQMIVGSSPQPPAPAAMAIATTRQAQEVQAAMIVARQFPRDETAALQRILRFCARPGLAELAIYEFPRGGQKVSGPSIRLAEAVAQAWGNMDCGIIELEQKHGESTVMAYAWDMETNFREQKVFTVSHAREVNDRENGGKKKVLLTDPRDIYEMVANQGARRLRACILAVIPGDIFDQAEAACEKTLKGNGQKPLADRIRDMIIAFGDLQVTKAMLDERLGMPVESASETQIAALRRIYTSLKDGIGKREEFFNVTAAPQNTAEPPAGKKSRTEAAKEKLAPAPSFKELEEKCLAVTTVDDVDAAKQVVLDHTGLSGEQRAKLLETLNAAEAQFLSQK
jgi:hypothetical protein